MTVNVLSADVVPAQWQEDPGDLTSKNRVQNVCARYFFGLCIVQAQTEDGVGVGGLRVEG